MYDVYMFLLRYLKIGFIAMKNRSFFGVLFTCMSLSVYLQACIESLILIKYGMINNDLRFILIQL